MNLRKMLSLVSYEASSFSFITRFGIVLVMTFIFLRNRIPSIQESNLTDLFVYGMVLMLIGAAAYEGVFFNKSKPGKIAARHPMAEVSPDFLFTLAIDQRFLFGVKSSLFLSILVLPLIGAWIRSYLLLPGDSSRDARFCLGILVLLLFETLHFVLRGWPSWLAGFLIFVLLGIPVFLEIRNSRSSHLYETGLAWMTNHGVLSFLILMAALLGSQVYCGWRFTQTEILS